MKNKFIEVITEAPILNTADFQKVFGGKNKKTLQTDKNGHIRALEFIALKEAAFEIIKKTSCPYIYQVKCNFYKKPNLFIDSRFTKKIAAYTNKKKILNLNFNELVKRLDSLVGTNYLWGGNWSRGVKDLLKYYPISSPPNDALLNKWQLKGVDCSGFLFEVTNGLTPRNTNELLTYKRPIKIEGLSPLQIVKTVKPLDLIVYQGHLIIILDSKFTIESRENFGVVKTPLIDRLKELFKSKTPSNSYKNPNHFVIRRWFFNL